MTEDEGKVRKLRAVRKVVPAVDDDHGRMRFDRRRPRRRICVAARAGGDGHPVPQDGLAGIHFQLDADLCGGQQILQYNHLARGVDGWRFGMLFDQAERGVGIVIEGTQLDPDRRGVLRRWGRPNVAAIDIVDLAEGELSAGRKLERRVDYTVG